MLVNLSSLTPTMHASLRNLISEIHTHDGISPINESASLCIDGLREADFFFLGQRNAPIGFAVCDLRDNTVLVAVHPEHRGSGHGTELLRQALDAYPHLGAWAFGTLPGATQVAAKAGLAPSRELLRMERALVATPSQVYTTSLRAFSPSDANAVVRINAAAFAHHPEQGLLTLDEFQQLTQQPWFDPAGLFLAEVGGEIVGFHWTKRHDQSLGEVYVIAVHPDWEGRGIGRDLLARGLYYLTATGATRVQLYVEAAAQRVVTLYLRAGFEIAQTDTLFSTPRSA